MIDLLAFNLLIYPKQHFPKATDHSVELLMKTGLKHRINFLREYSTIEAKK